METLKQQFYLHVSDAIIHLRGRERALDAEDIRHRIEKSRGCVALSRQRARAKPKPEISRCSGTPNRPMRRVEPERPRPLRTGLSDAAKGGEPAYPLSYNGAGEGVAPAPLRTPRTSRSRGGRAWGRRPLPPVSVRRDA